jgi:hypothetical protein
MRTLAKPADLRLLASRIASFTPNDRARWGRMNACQMLRHPFFDALTRKEWMRWG